MAVVDLVAPSLVFARGARCLLLSLVLILVSTSSADKPGSVDPTAVTIAFAFTPPSLAVE